MPISISCSKCQRKYNVRDELAGKVAKCQCGQAITIPQPDSPASQAAPQAPPIVEAAPVVPPANPLDPFAGISEEAFAQPSPLQPLSSSGKRRRGKKGVNPLLILAIAGGAVVAVLLVAVVVISLSGGGPQTAAAPTNPAPTTPTPPASNVRWATPEAVFEAQKKAALEGDWDTFYDTFSPSSQRILVGLMADITVKGAQVIPEFEAIRTEYELNKYKQDPKLLQLNDPAEIQKHIIAHFNSLANQVKDGPGLIARVMKTINNRNTKDPTGMVLQQVREGMKAEAEAKLSELKVVQDHASGTKAFIFQGRTKKEPIEFVKIDDEWRIEEKIPDGDDLSL